MGSDAPEISSSLSALRSGQHDLCLGIVFSSNILNLAALLGLSAVLAGKVKVSRRTLELYGILSPLVSVILIAAILVINVTLTSALPALLQRAAQIVGLGGQLGQLGQIGTDANRDAETSETSRRPSCADILDVLPSLVCIILASVGLVRSALVLGGAWKILWPSLVRSSSQALPAS